MIHASRRKVRIGDTYISVSYTTLTEFTTSLKVSNAPNTLCIVSGVFSCQRLICLERVPDPRGREKHRDGVGGEKPNVYPKYIIGTCEFRGCRLFLLLIRRRHVIVIDLHIQNFV